MIDTHVERKPMTYTADRSVLTCEHGVAIGFVVSAVNGHRSYCDRSECIREARKLRDSDPKHATVVVWGNHELPQGKDGVIP